MHPAVLMLASCGSTPKAEKITAGSVKLDPQAMFEFEGVRAESINWANARVTINGMIVWSWAMEGATCYEASWEDDGSHVFRIQLDTRKMESKNVLKNPEWIKRTKAPDYSQDCEIILEVTNPRYSDGKKTVVEYVWIKF